MRGHTVQTHINHFAYRYGVAAALVGVLLLIWLSLGVGIIGRDGDPANRMYFAVVAVGVAGSIVARFRPNGMARTSLAMALVQASIAAYAVIAQLGLPWSGPAELILLNGFFVAWFGAAAWLFGRAARAESVAGRAKAW
jgi:hypothetical protein